MAERHYLITGGTRGLGMAIVTRLLQNPGSVCHVVGRKTNPAFQELCNQYSQRISFLSFDLSGSVNIKKNIFSEFLPVKTPVSGYVNNAAMAYDDIITNLNLQKLEEMYRVNVFSPMMITNHVIRNMIFHQTQGSIVHVSSISAHTGYKGLAMYASTKGALEAFSKNTSREWGERGIRSNCLVAGFMETDMNVSLSEDQKERIYQRTSLKHPAQIESVAATIVFLLSDAASSITGQNIIVDSGTI